MFLRFFFSRKSIFAYILCIFNMFEIFRSRLHYDVIVTSYAGGWYLFWYQWKEDTHSYTVVANKGIQDVYYRKSRWGRNNPPFGGTCYRKWLRRTRVKAAFKVIPRATQPRDFMQLHILQRKPPFCLKVSLFAFLPGQCSKFQWKTFKCLFLVVEICSTQIQAYI